LVPRAEVVSIRPLANGVGRDLRCSEVADFAVSESHKVKDFPRVSSDLDVFNDGIAIVLTNQSVPKGGCQLGRERKWIYGFIELAGHRLVIVLRKA